MAKRFYKDAVTSPSDGDFWRVELDGKPVKTPTGKPLATRIRGVAERIRDEWEAQTDEIVPQTMPITRLVGVALERAGARDDLVSDIRAYASTDMLSYRKDSPEDLVQRQADAFDPILDWASDHGMPLRTTTGILAIEQDPLSLERIATHARLYDDVALTLFAHLTATYGSALLALYVMQGELSPGEAYDLSRTDERYQAEIWGEDEEAEMRAKAIREDTVAIAAVLPDLDIPRLDRDPI